MAELDKRDQFLIAMYNQLMNDINRHIIVVWQSIATLVAAIAAFSLVKDNIISIDIAVTVVLIACVWLIAHVYDASYWYNRNLVIIANIERQFLLQNDLKDIHYYFGKHRPPGTMISHLRIQRALGVAVAALVLLFHTYVVIVPALCGLKGFDLFNLGPWVVFLAGCWVWHRSARDSKIKYEEFLENSPGIAIDTSDIEYRSGHGFSQ